MAEVIHKTELTRLVAARLGVSQASAAVASAAVLDSLEQALTENDRVTLVGFGTFSVRERAARQMRAIAGENAGVPRQPFLPDASIDFAALTPSLTVDSALHRYDNL